MFDPYHKWLGIPKDQRPPTHYQLLGIAAGEADADVIEEAAVRQTAHVRNYQIGQHAADATRILNEISHAKLTLLNPAKRQAYDEQLAKRSASITAKAPAPQPVAVAADPAFAFDEMESRPPPPARREANIARPPRSNTGLIIGLSVGGAALVLLVIALVVLLSHRTEAVKPVIVKKEEKKEIKPILKIPDDPAEKEVPVIVNKPPVNVPPVVKPGVGAFVPGARSFKTQESQIEHLSLSPDGGKVAVAFLNPHVHDVATGNHLAMFPPVKVGGAVMTPVAFAPDNRRLLYSYGSDPGASLGDVVTGQILFNLPQQGVQYASALAVSADGKRALTGHNYRLVYWDLENQKEITSWGVKYIVHALAFTPNGSKAVSAGDQGAIDYWDLEKLAQIREIRNPNLGGVHSFSMAPDGNSIAVGSTRSLAIVEFTKFTVKVINVNVGNIPDDPKNHTAVAFFGKGKHLLTAGKNGLVHVIDLEQMRVVAWKGHTAEVTRIAVDVNERVAVSGDKSGTVFVWPLPEGQIAAGPQQPAIPAGAAKGMKQIVTRKLQGTYAVSILPDGKSFVIGGLRVQHWDLNGAMRHEFAKRGSTGARFLLSVSADGKRAAWAENKDPPTVIDLEKGGQIARLAGPANVSGMALSPDGTRMLVGFADGSALVWDVATQQVVQELPKQTPHVFSVSFVPGGKQALVARINGKVELLDAATWNPAAEAMIGVFPSTPAYSSDGQTAALATNRGVWLLDTRTLQTLAQLPINNVQRLAFCAKGQVLLTMAGAEQAIAVWDVAKRQVLTRWELSERCHTFTVDPQESLLLAIAVTGNAYTWPLPTTPQDVVAGLAPPPRQAAADAKLHEVPPEGLIIRDVLAPQDQQLLFKLSATASANRPARSFAVKLQAGQQYRFDLEGSDKLDPLLAIHDPAGVQLAADDDSGGGLNSMIQLMPAADGIYRISAGTLTGQGGEFVLRIRKLAP